MIKSPLLEFPGGIWRRRDIIRDYTATTPASLAAIQPGLEKENPSNHRTIHGENVARW